MFLPRAVARKGGHAALPTPATKPPPADDVQAPSAQSVDVLNVEAADASDVLESVPPAEPSRRRQDVASSDLGPPPRLRTNDDEGAVSPDGHPSRGCILFVRGFAPGTSRNELQRMLDDMAEDEEGAVEYVDLERGLDFCHVRLKHPAAADRLTAKLAGGIDGLRLERITGLREAIYLEKVPRTSRKRPRPRR